MTTENDLTVDQLLSCARLAANQVVCAAAELVTGVRALARRMVDSHSIDNQRRRK